MSAVAEVRAFVTWYTTAADPPPTLRQSQLAYGNSSRFLLAKHVPPVQSGDVAIDFDGTWTERLDAAGVSVLDTAPGPVAVQGGIVFVTPPVWRPSRRRASTKIEPVLDAFAIVSMPMIWKSSVEDPKLPSSMTRLSRL